MGSDLFVWAYWLLAACFSNAPFWISHKKSHVFLLWLFSCLVFFLTSLFIESRYSVIQTKTFSFYIVFVIVFLVLALPSFVIRFLKKG